MTEFKQIIGRGTRVREDKEKLFFTILDYTGSATRNFADVDFDGEPPLITEEQIDEDGNVIEIEEWESENNDATENDSTEEFGSPSTTVSTPRPKYFVTEGTASIIIETVSIVGENGKLRTVEFTKFAKEQIITLFPTVDDLRNRWNNLDQRNHIFEELENSGISIEQLLDITKQKELDPFDLLCYVAFDLKPMTRKQRADLLKRNKPDFFIHYSEKARDILNMILEKYIDYGLNQIRPDIISVEPITQQGNAIEILEEFGGIEEFTKAIKELQSLLYSDAA
jgi:type I restriction enzyme R subunit